MIKYNENENNNEKQIIIGKAKIGQDTGKKIYNIKT